MDWSMYSEDERAELGPIYERLRAHGLHWGVESFDMEALDRIFSNDKWSYRLESFPWGYRALVELRFHADVVDRGMDDGRRPEIAILKAPDQTITNGFTKGDRLYL